MSSALVSRFAADEVRRAFSAFPSGVVAVAASVDGLPVGLAASSFTSVSLDPPLVSVSIARDSKTWPVLRTAARIGISVLARQHAGVCRRLAGPAADRFTDLAVRATDGGALFIADAAGAFECSVEQEVVAGDHVIVVLRLHEIEHGTAPPLVFHRSRLSTVGVSLR